MFLGRWSEKRWQFKMIENWWILNFIFDIEEEENGSSEMINLNSHYWRFIIDDSLEMMIKKSSNYIERNPFSQQKK